MTRLEKPSFENDICFEDALEKLEAVVRQLEKGELLLEDALDKYAEGIKLSKICLDKLNQAEKQINEILLEEQGRIKVKPMVLEEE